MAACVVYKGNKTVIQWLVEVADLDTKMVTSSTFKHALWDWYVLLYLNFRCLAMVCDVTKMIMSISPQEFAARHQTKLCACDPKP